MDSVVSPGSCAAVALVRVLCQRYLVAAGVDAGRQKLPRVPADQWHAGQCCPAWHRLSFPGALFSVVAWFISADYAGRIHNEYTQLLMLSRQLRRLVRSRQIQRLLVLRSHGRTFSIIGAPPPQALEHFFLFTGPAETNLANVRIADDMRPGLPPAPPLLAVQNHLRQHILAFLQPAVQQFRTPDRPAHDVTCSPRHLPWRLCPSHHAPPGTPNRRLHERYAC